MDPSRRPSAVVASTRLYRWLLKAYPRDYRREWAESMEQLFRDCAVDAFSQRGFFGLAALWGRTLWDYATSLIREYGRRPRRAVQGSRFPAGHPGSNFTPRAQQALAWARKEAGRLNHGYVGTEHLLLGILIVPRNMALEILKKLEVDPSLLRSALERKMGPATTGAGTSMAPFSIGVKRIIGIAANEAKRAGHNYLGCEHLLLALARSGDGLPGVLLREFKVKAEDCRRELPRMALPIETALVSVGGPGPVFEGRIHLATFDGEGRYVRQNAHENIFGQISLRLTLVASADFPLPTTPRVSFGVSEEQLPSEQWPVVQRAIEGWHRANPSAFGKWYATVHVCDGRWEAGATPAFEQAAVGALKEALKQAAAAGLLPN